TEHDGLGEDPGDQELPVVDTSGNGDRTAEHVGEEQHEHDRGEQDPDDHLGHPLHLDQVALGDDEAVGHGPAQSVHRVTSCVCFSSTEEPLLLDSVLCPVRARNTSSSVGRRSPTSRTVTWVPSRPRSTSIKTPLPPETGAVTVRVCSSTMISPTATVVRVSRASER